MSARLNPMRSQFSIPVLWNSCSELVAWGGIKVWDPVEDSDTDGPMMGGVLGQKSYLGPAEIASFSRRDFSRSYKHDTFWRVLSTWYF